ncbi:MAG: caspase family protein [bacterium]|nr:caspase family protein [bacterium]
MNKALISALVLALGVTPSPGAAVSAKCEQAQAMVDKIERRLPESPPDKATLEPLLLRLETARNLCPELGVAWKHSYCIAKVLGETERARYFRDRAVFSGVDDLECSFTVDDPAEIAEQSQAATAMQADPSLPPAPPPAPPPGPVREKHALIIGIGRFQDTRIPQLEFTAKDAQDLYATLVDPRYGRFHPDNVQLLVDEDATRERILVGLQRLHEDAGEDDLVLIYVSSHGSDQQAGVGLQGVGHIITHDTQADQLYVDALPMEDFADNVATISARRKVTFLDTCYSGQAFADGSKRLSIEPLGVSAQAAKLFLSGEGTYVIASSTDTQRSWESRRLQNGYFTYYLIEALRASSTPLTLRELFERLATNVTRAVGQERGQSQEPQFHPPSGAGDLRIAVEPSWQQHPSSQGGRQ